MSALLRHGSDRRKLWILALAFGVAAEAQPAQELKPEVLLLARAKAHLRGALAHLPDYTCLETIQRFRKAAGRGQTMRPVDTMRLEVLYSGSVELYASPGSTNFLDEGPWSFATSGLIGNGTFALLVKSVFLSGGAALTYGGEADVGGRRAARYRFALPSLHSGFTINLGAAKETVGSVGSAWVDPETLDVLRIESSADEIPPNLPIMEQTTSLTYARTRVGSEDVMLPQSGEMRMLMMSGLEERNLFEFTHCRAFHAESSISFLPEQTGVPRGVARAAAEPSKALPAGLQIKIALAAPITDKAMVGALIEGKVDRDVTAGRKVIVPEGAAVHGRIRQLEYHREARGFALGLEFTEIESGGATWRFYADLAGLDPFPGSEGVFKENRYRNGITLGRGTAGAPAVEKLLPDLPGVGSFFLRGDRFILPKGYGTLWKTRQEK